MLLQNFIQSCKLWVCSTSNHLHSFNLKTSKLQQQSNIFPGIMILFLSNLLLHQSGLLEQALSIFVKFEISFLQAGKQRRVHFVAKRYLNTFRDMVIGSVSSEFFELFTIFQSGRNNETGQIWAFDCASGIFRESNPWHWLYSWSSSSRSCSSFKNTFVDDDDDMQVIMNKFWCQYLT